MDRLDRGRLRVSDRIAVLYLGIEPVLATTLRLGCSAERFWKGGMGIFDKLRGIAGEKSRRFSDELKRLNEVERGLGDKALNFVLNGEDETCLSTIGNKVSIEDYHPDKYDRTEKQTLQLWRWLFKDGSIDVETIARYAQVLGSMTGHVESTLPGTKNVPLNLRVFAHIIFRGVYDHHPLWAGRIIRRLDWSDFRPEKLPEKISFTIERMLAIAAELEATPADFFDVVLHYDGQWRRVDGGAYLKLVNINSYLISHLDDVLIAAKRIHAEGRAALMPRLIENRLGARPEVIDFLMQEVGGSAKTTREQAIACLRAVPQEKVEGLAVELLKAGNAAQRAGMVALLGSIGSDNALQALKDHLAVEKTAKVKAAINSLFATQEVIEQAETSADSNKGYTAIDGSWVDIPEFKPLPPMERPALGPDDLAELNEVREKFNAADKKRVEEQKAAGSKYARHYPIDADVPSRIVKIFNHEPLKPAGKDWQQSIYWQRSSARHLLERGEFKTWSQKAMSRLSDTEKAIVSFRFVANAYEATGGGYLSDSFSATLEDWLNGPEGDVRQFVAWDLDMQRTGFSEYRGTRGHNIFRFGSLLDQILHSNGELITGVPKTAVWPYFAEAMEELDVAFGLKPNSSGLASKYGALKVLQAFPKTPMRYFGPVLEIATGVNKRGRDIAQSLLESVDDIDDRLIPLLSDGRQAVRAGVADWLGNRGAKAALPALKAQLKKEKSEIARASILNAMEKLGENLDSYIGEKALIKETEAGIKKAKFDKLDWLAFNTLGGVRFKNGKPVPDDVLRYWIYQAFKLKQPGGNKLFELYLDQLTPESAESFSTWIFDSWMSYDTATVSDDEANAYAKQHLPQRWKQHQQWVKRYREHSSGDSWFKSYASTTEDQIFDQLKREILSNYLNSGAASKGVLGLATRAPATMMAQRVRAYLKQHGARTSQASSLLELLAACGDPVSLQVVISASTRLKQKGVQARAGELLQAVADEKNWTMDELADRTIPTAGFDDSGILELPCTPAEKMYTGVLDENLKLVLRNPDGKAIKALPAGDDEHTKASKKALTAAKKELKQVIDMQSQRLYEALCAERSWSPEDWERDFRNHPLMNQLVQRLVWLCLDKDGVVTASFRPTAEGELINTDDDEVELDCNSIRLAHGALMDNDAEEAWQTHLKDYEIKPLFKQFGRSLRRLGDSDKDLMQITDRLGWVTDAFTIRGAASKLGYERGQAEDGGWFHEYSKPFQSAGIRAVIEFTGNSLPEENIAAALTELYFVNAKTRGRRGAKMKLSDVPPVLLSECWNDYHDMASKAKFDAKWESTTQW